jgi:uncharacterized metal-binding protein YceD (DUF177 family)
MRYFRHDINARGEVLVLCSRCATTLSSSSSTTTTITITSSSTKQE